MKLKNYDEKRLNRRVKAYFAKREAETGEYKCPVTVAGLACELNVRRGDLLRVSEGDRHYEAVFSALRKIEAYSEEQLFSGKGATGIMFSLKANFGWKDLPEAEGSPAPPDLSGLSLEDLRRIGGLDGGKQLDNLA